MKNFLLVTAILLSSFTSVTYAQDIQWSLVKDKDKLKVYKGTVANSPLVAFRGIKTIPVSIGKISAVMFTQDMEIRKKWVDALESTANLEQKSQNSAVIYNAFRAPWPIKARDFVSLAQLTVSPEQKSILLTIKSTQHPKAPATVGVRAEVIHSAYTLKVLGPQETEVTMEALVDFKGSLPHWLVNLVQSRWPEKTLEKLESVSAEPTITELEWVAPALKLER